MNERFLKYVTIDGDMITTNFNSIAEIRRGGAEDDKDVTYIVTTIQEVIWEVDIPYEELIDKMHSGSMGPYTIVDATMLSLTPPPGKEK